MLHALDLALAATALLSPLHVDGHRLAQLNDPFANAVRAPILALRTIIITPGRQLIGREVSVRDVSVARVDRDGFWIGEPHTDDHIFVLPAEGSLIGVSPGDIVSLRGEIRQMTDPLRRTLHTTAPWDERLYVYAYIVRPTGISDYRMIGLPTGTAESESSRP